MTELYYNWIFFLFFTFSFYSVMSPYLLEESKTYKNCADLWVAIKG